MYMIWGTKQWSGFSRTSIGRDPERGMKGCWKGRGMLSARVNSSGEHMTQRKYSQVAHLFLQAAWRYP